LSQNGFAALGVAEPLVRALDAAGFVTPTPIQAQAIPPLLDDYDLLGIAQTGTGKTAAFALPIIQHLSEDRVRLPAKSIRALILAPTRELAIQIDEQIALFAKGLRLRHAVIFGGVSQVPQAKALAGGLEILTATPGRLLDLMQQRLVSLDSVTHLVLDEADRMLDMGFVRDVMKIVRAVPVERQTLLFSATMPEARSSQARPRHAVGADARRGDARVVTVEAIEQQRLSTSARQPTKRSSARRSC
jgi:ATP-dependent RNA helicase RhlE